MLKVNSHLCLHVPADVYYPGPSFLLLHDQTISMGQGLYFPFKEKPVLSVVVQKEEEDKFWEELIVKGKPVPSSKGPCGPKHSGNLNVQGYQAHPPKYSILSLSEPLFSFGPRVYHRRLYT